MEPPTLALLIPIIAIVMVFGTGMVSIYFNYRKRKDLFAMHHQERMAAIEKGLDLPPLPEEFFDEDGKPRSRGSRGSHGSLRTGLILMAVGLTLGVALLSDKDAGQSDKAGYALIPAGIGVALLIYYFAVGRGLALAMEEERKARLADASRSGNPPA